MKKNCAGLQDTGAGVPQNIHLTVLKNTKRKIYCSHICSSVETAIVWEVLCLLSPLTENTETRAIFTSSASMAKIRVSDLVLKWEWFKGHLEAC